MALPQTTADQEITWNESKTIGDVSLRTNDGMHNWSLTRIILDKCDHWGQKVFTVYDTDGNLVNGDTTASDLAGKTVTVKVEVVEVGKLSFI